MYYYETKSDFLIHSGVQGMKWGVRRYQNSDGSLTEEGKRHYYKSRFKDYKHEISRSKSGNTRALREFYNDESNRDLKKRVNAQIEKQNKVEREYLDAERARDIAEITKSVNSKEYKKANANYDRIGKKYDKVWNESTNLGDEIARKANDFANNFFGEYGSKIVKGLNVPSKGRTAAELLAREIYNNTAGYSSVEDSLYKR